jgi:hypothetical protein
MAMIGPGKISRAVFASADVGVSPPTAIPQFSSMRSTDRLAARATSSIPPTQSSTLMFRCERVAFVIKRLFLDCGSLLPLWARQPAAEP